MKNILVTGAAGFLGSSLVDRLLARGDRVVGLDNFSPQYDPALKRANLKEALDCGSFTLHEADVTRADTVRRIVAEEAPGCVVHIAGRTGMKASVADPEPYFRANVSGTLSVLEACRSAGTRHFIYISSGSVYGTATRPVPEDFPLPPPSNPYAATKILAEGLSRSYAGLFGMDTTVLRVFTVYGPRQRAEMAIHRFIRQIDEGRPVEVYGDGSDRRDYLHIDNCTDAIVLAIDTPFRFEVINIGEQRTLTLNETVRLISAILGRTAEIAHVPVPEGIPRATCADIGKAARILGYSPKVTIEEGLRGFVSWYRNTRQTP